MQRAKRQRGATLVEFAVVLPVFFILIMGIYEFGRAYNIQQTLTDAAREGARYSVAPMAGTDTLPSVSGVTDWVNTFLTSDGVTGTVSVNQTLSRTVNGIPEVYTQVDVSAPYRFLFFPYGTITLTAHSVMRNETN
jgi:Flp pilus assembly protein TadG